MCVWCKGRSLPWYLSQQEAQQLLCISPDSAEGSTSLLGDPRKGEESTEAVASQMDGFESHKQNICASTWQVLLSSMSQKRPVKQKQKLFLNRGGRFLGSRRNWRSMIRTRNKEATGGGWERRKNHRSQSRTDHTSPSLASGVILLYLWFSYAICCYPLCL